MVPTAGATAHSACRMAQLLRTQSPLPNVLKCKGPPERMSAKTFAKQKGAILPRLRKRTDPPPRLMRPGTGAADDWRKDLLALLERPDAVPVRGFRLYKLPIDTGYWGEPAWLATAHVVVATVSESGNVVYADPTACEEGEYIFVPSDRMHTDLTTEQMLSGEWQMGRVVGGHPRFCEGFVLHEQVHGRQRSIIASAPEDLVAKRSVFVRSMPHYKEWYEKGAHINDLEVQAEMMGAAVFNMGTEVSQTDAITVYQAIINNTEALIDGVDGLKLELEVHKKLMRGELSVDDAKQLFFKYFDSCATRVSEEQTRRLLTKLEENGFNTLYA